MPFRADLGIRLKIKPKTGFKTMKFIYPENLGLLDLFLSEIE